MFIKRHIEETVAKVSQMFGAVMLCGARQVGKTTLLKNFADESVGYVTLDDPAVLLSAKQESATFLKDNPPPLIIDEVQYAPEIFPHIKMSIDNQEADKKAGQFFLSGSQQFRMMKNVGESLTGRVGILTLHGLSLREIRDADFHTPFVPTVEFLTERKKHSGNTEYDDVWNTIHRGPMPALWANSDVDWQIFYAAYTKTYIERDVHDLAQVGDETKFIRFMIVAASMIGQMLNISSLARDVGISVPTAERWLSIMQASNIIYLLQPFYNNLAKRAIKTPKLYFFDTGLAAHLTRWSSPDVLKNGAMAGNFFENFVIVEIMKSYFNAGIEPPIYFYRDKEKVEIDLLIERDGVFYPIEIKKHADPRVEDFSSFHVLDKIPGMKRGTGGLVCMYEKTARFAENQIIVPAGMI